MAPRELRLELFPDHRQASVETTIGRQDLIEMLGVAVAVVGDPSASSLNNAWIRDEAVVTEKLSRAK